MSKVTYRSASIGRVTVFYREAGDPRAPSVLLLHGFPTSSHMFRELIPALGDRYHVVAPDLPGFGFTEAPPRGEFEYRFDRLADMSSIMARRSGSASLCATRSGSLR
jgi:pimeloyl-ACP methyl ester carboxylesterase